jgi:hypothetical protein
MPCNIVALQHSLAILPCANEKIISIFFFIAIHRAGWDSFLYVFERVPDTRSRIHERTTSLRFLGIILRVLKLEVSVYNVYFSNHLLQGGGGGGSKIL